MMGRRPGVPGTERHVERPLLAFGSSGPSGRPESQKPLSKGQQRARDPVARPSNLSLHPH